NSEARSHRYQPRCAHPVSTPSHQPLAHVPPRTISSMLPSGSNSMKRRSFLTTLGTAPALAAVQRPSTASRAPRKIIVGTVMQQFWVPHPGLTARLSELCAIIDSMQTASRQRYGRGIDLAILPECAVTGEASVKSSFRAVPMQGEFRDTFAAKA